MINLYSFTSTTDVDAWFSVEAESRESTALEIIEHVMIETEEADRRRIFISRADVPALIAALQSTLDPEATNEMPVTPAEPSPINLTCPVCLAYIVEGMMLSVDNGVTTVKCGNCGYSNDLP